MLKQHSYQGYAITIKVKIHDVDVTDDVASLDDITRSLDYPNLTEFRVDEASFTLRDLNGDYAPKNASNFFTRHGGQRTGRNSPVTIEVGFIVNGTRHTQTIFQGIIIRLVQDASNATIKITCTDNFGDMREKNITDFGVSRHFRLIEDTELTDENGVYPIMKAVMPASEGSVTLARFTGDDVQPQQKLKNEGTLRTSNFVVDDNAVRTEGGPIENAQNGYPQLQMKSPLRYRHLKDVISAVLTHYGITSSEIAIPERDVNSHFSSNGRINYDLIGNIGSSNPITWNGHVTDFLYDSDNSKWYFLYNKHRHNPNGFSQVIEYNEATRTYTKLHGFSNTTEVWKFTKADDNLYILATTGGNYDANETDSENQIIQLDITGPTETVFVANSVSLRPQLAHFYQGVGSLFMKPDSRRPLVYRENDGLYYAYCDEVNSQFGVAKVTTQGATPTAVITMNTDTYDNQAGIGLDINGSTLIGGVTFVSGGNSQVLVFKKNL